MPGSNQWGRTGLPPRTKVPFHTSGNNAHNAHFSSLSPVYRTHAPHRSAWARIWRRSCRTRRACRRRPSSACPPPLTTRIVITALGLQTGSVCSNRTPTFCPTSCRSPGKVTTPGAVTDWGGATRRLRARQGGLGATRTSRTEFAVQHRHPRTLNGSGASGDVGPRHRLDLAWPMAFRARTRTNHFSLASTRIPRCRSIACNHHDTLESGEAYLCRESRWLRQCGWNDNRHDSPQFLS